MTEEELKAAEALVANQEKAKANAVETAKVEAKKEWVDPRPEAERPVLVKSVNKEFFDNTVEETKGLYPFYQLEVGDGFFVPVSDKLNAEKLNRTMHSQISALRNQYAETECDADGDEVWETVIVKNKDRNADGSLKLQPNGDVNESASQVMRPVLINPRRFIVKKINKDCEIGDGKKATNNGVLVIRVA